MSHYLVFKTRRSQADKSVGDAQTHALTLFLAKKCCTHRQFFATFSQNHNSQMFGTSPSPLPQRGQPSLFRALWRAFGAQFAVAGVWRVLVDGFSFLGPLLLGRLVQVVSGDAPATQACCWTPLSAHVCHVMPTVLLGVGQIQPDALSSFLR